MAIKREFLFIFSIVFCMGIVFAGITVSTGGVAFSSINESITSQYNITIENLNTTAPENWTEVNVTMPNGFVFVADSNDSDTGTHTFSNTSTVLSWNNDGLIMNLTNQSFWFNATASSSPGDYNFTITALNSSGDLVETQNISVTVTDTVAPNITFSCTPTNPTTADTMTCTCVGSDVGGVDTTLYTVNPDISLPGEFTQTCVVNDTSGNSVSASVSYVVYDANYGSGGGGTTSPWDKTYVPTKEELIIGYSNELKKDERVKMRIGTDYHYVGLTGLTSTTATISVQSTPQEATLNIGDEKKFDVLGEGFYDLSVKLDSITNNQASLVLTTIHESISEENVVVADNEDSGSEEATTEDNITQEGKTPWLLIVVMIVVLLVLGWFAYNRYQR